MSIKNIIYTPNYEKQRLQMDPKEIAKLEQSITVHGYRGSSKGKHNGVVNIKPDDKQLWKNLKEFVEIDKKFIEETIERNNEIFLIETKIVAHCPNGNRAVGLLYKNKSNNKNLTLYVLGFTNYNYSLF